MYQKTEDGREDSKQAKPEEQEKSDSEEKK